MRATYALGCLGKHSSDHAKALAENDVLNNLMQILINPNSIEELKKECRRALKMIIQNCTSVQALDKIITDVIFLTNQGNPWQYFGARIQTAGQGPTYGHKCQETICYQ
jgi:hypothetical protein